MTDINHVATATSKGFMPTTNRSTLVYGEYKGFPLPSGKAYRSPNIDKVNSFLALGIESQQNFYSFEVYEESLKFADGFNYFDPTARYLKSELDTHIKLVIFTHKKEVEVVSFLMKYTDDFAVKRSIQNVAENAIEVASISYELAEHFLIPKHARKAKQMTGNDLTPDEKLMSVEFELKPNLVLRS